MSTSPQGQFLKEAEEAETTLIDRDRPFRRRYRGRNLHPASRQTVRRRTSWPLGKLVHSLFFLDKSWSVNENYGTGLEAGVNFFLLKICIAFYHLVC